MGNTVLVPIDGSDSSIKAVEFTISIMKQGDRVVLMNVQKPQYDGFEKVGNVSKEQLDAFYLDEGRKILTSAEELIKKQGISYESVVRIGLPSIEITKVAKEISAHSIVMGSKGMSPVVSHALGSVTYSVIHLAACPVTVVPLMD
ncbi:universal stress protein [Bacillus dakarensis]|uniref:universal stress protein n=1 Tax=Robertmurraya dakarensis TaxID=1926278 RepID=UPI000980D4E8|nr:universal stress protein [Bacillus dakarensis]